MATFLICHGAWSAGWAWGKMRPLLRAAGHEIFTPSYTGLGERAHLAHPLVGLATHVRDILGVIECEDLRDFILLGHSYGGMVATGVADLVPQLVRRLVYLDAFVPADGQSLDDLRGMTAVHPDAVEGWLVPPMPPAPDTSEADLAWTAPRRRHQPVRTFSDRLRLRHPGPPTFPRSYIYCSRKGPGDVFRQFADRFKDAPDWHYVDLDASHSPNVTAPEALAAILDGLAG
jgi:pimeloyl-ACP methyl ester carboxylesterase